MHHNVRAENPQAEPLERYKTADVIGTLLCLQNHAEWARHDNERICVAVICPVSGNMKSSQPSYPIPKPRETAIALLRSGLAGKVKTADAIKKLD